MDNCKITENESCLEKELENTTLYRYMRMGATRVLMRLLEWNCIPKKPLIKAECKNSVRGQNDIILNVLIKNCLNDSYFLNSFLLDEEMVLKWGNIEVKGKKYKDLKIIPQKLL